jgi:hypothetical protein
LLKAAAALSGVVSAGSGFVFGPISAAAWVISSGKSPLPQARFRLFLSDAISFLGQNGKV